MHRNVIIAAALLVLLLAQRPAAAAPLPLNFREAVERVLARDPQIATARALYGAAQARATIAASQLWPHAGVSANYGESKDRDLAASQRVDRRTTLTQGYLRWNVFNGLADKAEVDASRKDVEAAGLELLRAIDEAGERCALAYVDVLRLQALADRAALRRSEVEELARLVRRQTDAGKSSEADGELAASSLADARVGDETARAQLSVARIRLETLIGTALGRLSEAAPVPLLDDSDALDALLARAKRGNAQWRAAELRAAAAHARATPVPPDLLPKVDVQVTKRLGGSTTPPNASSQTQHGWSLSLVYDIPLGGEAGARRDEARQRALAAESEARRVGDDVRSQLGETQQTARQTLAAEPQLRQQVLSLDAVVRASQLQWDAGRRSLLQLMEVRDSRYAAQQREVDNRLRLITARLRLLLLTGELGSALGLDDQPLDGEARPKPPL